MLRRLALVTMLLLGCGDAGDETGPCNTLSQAACGERTDCLPLMAWDVTSEPPGGEPCWRGPTGDWGEQIYLRCVLRPGMMSGDLRFAADPDTGRCYAFASGTLVPSGWRECMDVLPECTCRNDGHCPSGEGCILYGTYEQRCRAPQDAPVACTYDDFPVTGDPCTEPTTACRPYLCDRDCAPTCTCDAGTWSCAEEVCITSPDAGRPECGEPPACSASCL